MAIDEREESVLELVLRLAEHEDAGGALSRICELLRNRVPHYDWVGYYLAVPEERLLVLGPFAGAPTEHIRIPYGVGICGQAASVGRTFVVPDVTAESNYLSCSLLTRAEVVFPIYREGALVGELDIDSHSRDPFTDEDLRLLDAVAEATAPLVDRLRPRSA